MQTQIPQIPRLALKKSVMRLASKKSKKSVSDLPEDIIEDILLRVKSVIRPALKKSKKSVIGPPLKKSKKSVAEEILSSHLPEEIIEEILSRLPVKSLLRFRCVSKSWLSLIESDRFINIHYQNSTKNTSLEHHRALFNANLTRIDGCSLLTLSNWNSLYSSITSIDPTNHMPRIGYIVGCYNGVVCYSPNLAYFNYTLWNPATRVFVDLPKLLGRVLTKSGFGWDESSGAFKVFASSVRDDLNYKVLGQVFSSKTGLWKTVPVGSLQLFNEYGVFVRGRIHWAAWGGREHVIESFNLESDEFERIEVPPFKENTYEANAYKGEGRWPRTLLGEIGGRLCALFHCNEIDVWVMKEYGVKDSWLKLLTLPRDVCLPELNSSIFGVCQNGEIKIVYGNNFVVYSPKEKEEDDDFSKVFNIGSCVRNHVYVESLVSPLRILGGKTIT